MTAVGHLGGLAPLATLPAWLVAAADPAQVADAAGRHLPELTGGQDGTVVGCKVERLAAARRRLGGALPADRRRRRRRRRRAQRAPGGDPAPTGAGGRSGQPAGAGPGAAPEPEDPGLPELPLLTDPERACPYLEALLREVGSPRLAGLRLAGCSAEVLRYKAGNRCTIRYLLEHGPGGEGQDWPELVIAKTYAKDAGAGTWAGMRALWTSGLSSGSWSPWPSRRLRPGAPGAGAGAGPWGPHPQAAGAPGPGRRFPGGARRAGGDPGAIAAGLAAMHRSGVSDGARVGWGDELAKLRAALPGLALAGRHVAEAAGELVRVLALAEAATPADPPGLAHRAFRPAQVLLDAGRGGRVGFIDFDGFCQAEPAMDLGVFRAAMVNIGMVRARSRPCGAVRPSCLGRRAERPVPRRLQRAGRRLAPAGRRVGGARARHIRPERLDQGPAGPAAEPSGRTRGERNIDNPHNREMMNPTTT